MQHFFRYTLDGDPHLNMKLIYAGLVIAIIIAYRFRKNDKLLKVLLATNVLLQIILFIWYLGYKELFIMEGLPLYHCRIAVLMMAVGYVAKKPVISRYFAWLGIIGTIIAFGVPDPSDYLWPHLTNITFICTHYLIAMSSLIIISRNEVKLNFREDVYKRQGDKSEDKIKEIAKYVDDELRHTSKMLNSNPNYRSAVLTDVYKRQLWHCRWGKVL